MKEQLKNEVDNLKEKGIVCYFRFNDEHKAEECKKMLNNQNITSKSD